MLLKERHIEVQPIHKNTRKLRGRKIDGVVHLQRVPFHIQGRVKKYNVKTQRCIVETRTNKDLNIPADAVRALL